MYLRSLFAVLAATVLCGCSVGVPPDNVAPVSNGRHEDAAETPPPAAGTSLPWLHADGRRIVNEAGLPVRLAGANIGGWLLVEPWIPGLDGQKGFETEKEMWDLLGRRFGEEGKRELIKVYRDHFFTEDDIQRMAGLGLNCLRIPIWWRAVTEPAYGGDITYLDRCIRWCSKHGVYVVIDLQGAPGGQASESANVGEPADGGQLWKKQEHKDETVRWWKMIAERYKDEPAVAMYDLLNEGTATPKHDDLVALYDALYKAIREIDTKHMIVMEDVWGWHRLPRAADMGWSNVVYSFHYYPRGMKLEQVLEAPDADLPKYNRTALYHDVPVYIGEFSPIDFRNGGVDAFLKYREVFDYFGWAWTFWNWKKIEDNDNVLWGVYGYHAAPPRPDLNADSFETIAKAFERMATRYSNPHPLLPAALLAPNRWQADPDFGPGSVALSLRDAWTFPGQSGYLRYEWGLTPPNLGYWTLGDIAAWKADVPEAGVYELGFSMANHSDSSAVQLWVDGVHVADAPIGSSGGYRKYSDRLVAHLDLTEGRHVIEIGQADQNKGFVNLRHGWLKPAEAPATAPSEDAIRLRPVAMDPLPAGSPLRVEWLNNPPNLAEWRAGEKVSWTIRLARGGTYAADVIYATPNDDTTLRLIIDGKQFLGGNLKSSGDWQNYKIVEVGTVELPPGTHTITAKWDVGRPTAAGNLRGVNLQRVP